jgi:hypothetical protein
LPHRPPPARRVKCQGHDGGRGTEAACPSRGFIANVHREGQDDQAGEQDRHASELADVDALPYPAVRILGENGRVIVGVAIRMKLRDQYVHELSGEQQRR